MRMIDADELKNQIRHMPRTINPDLVQYSLVKAIIENMPTLTPPNEPLTCRGCMHAPDCPSGIHCYGCARLYADNYRRPPEVQS